MRYIILMILVSCASPKPAVSVKHEGIELRGVNLQEALQIADSVNRVERERLIFIIDSLKQYTEAIPDLQRQIDVLKAPKDEEPR